MTEPHDPFSAEIFERFRVATSESLHDAAGEIPDLVYHYTSAEACFGILHTTSEQVEPCLWASSAFCLNDTTEISHGLEVVHAIAKEVVEQTVVDQMLGQNPNGHYRQLDFMQDTCVASFCAKPDLLSQWRAYGQGGAGYAIGFHRENLARTAASKRYELIPVIYQRRQQECVVRKFLKKAYEIPDQLREPAFAMRVVAEAIHLALVFKNESFSEEHEWRLVSPRPAGVMHYRAGRAAFMPYRKIYFPRSCIVELWQGPTLDQEMTRHLWDPYLKRNYGSDAAGNPAVSIRTSKIPLRSV